MAIIDLNYMSACLHRYVQVKVVLPIEDTYFTDRPFPKSFKTLYLLHGYTGNQNDWLYSSSVFQMAKTYNLAIVMPAGENGFYVDHKEEGLLYEKMISTELVELTRAMFPLSKDLEDTWIGGLSMGGYGSLRIGLKYHSIFGKIIALSGAYFDSGREDDALFKMVNCSKEYLIKLLHNFSDEYNPLSYAHTDKQLIYMACGTNDPLYQNNVKMVQQLKDKHMNVRFDIDEYGHEWSFWDKYLEKGISFHLLKSER